jgi:hypothetical protein
VIVVAGIPLLILATLTIQHALNVTQLLSDLIRKAAGIMDNETENKDDIGDAIVGAATGAVLSGATAAIIGAVVGGIEGGILGAILAAEDED